MDPPPSDPSASGTMRAATAAPAPPLEPPGVTSGFQGLIVGPYSRGSVPMHQPSSGVLVRPSKTKPACLMRDHLRIDVADEVLKVAKACGQARALPHRADILEQEWNAGEGARRRHLGCLHSRLVEGPDDHGVQPRLKILDDCDRGLDQFTGRHLAAPHKIGEAQRVTVCVELHQVGSDGSHGTFPSYSPGRAAQRRFCPGARHTPG